MTAPKTNHAPSPRPPRSTPSAVTPVAAEVMPALTESHPAAHQAPHIPAHSQASTGGEVFVSPRAIDQQAFDELSRSLREIVREAARQIGIAVAGVVHLMAPDVFVLGGGLLEAMHDAFIEQVSKSARKRVMPAYKDTFEVRGSKLGDDAVALGAAAWARRKFASTAEPAMS